MTRRRPPTDWLRLCRSLFCVSVFCMFSANEHRHCNKLLREVGRADNLVHHQLKSPPSSTCCNLGSPSEARDTTKLRLWLVPLVTLKLRYLLDLYSGPVHCARDFTFTKGCERLYHSHVCSLPSPNAGISRCFVCRVYMLATEELGGRVRHDSMRLDPCARSTQVCYRGVLSNYKGAISSRQQYTNKALTTRAAMILQMRRVLGRSPARDPGPRNFLSRDVIPITATN